MTDIDVAGEPNSTERGGFTEASPRMHIGGFGERTGMSHRTIRHYDEIGLLQPSARTEGGFRLYTERDVEEMLLIRRMKPLGYSLDEMAQLLEVFRGLRDGTADAEARQRVDGFVADARARRTRLAQQLGWAAEFLGLLADLAPGTGTGAGTEGVPGDSR